MYGDAVQFPQQIGSMTVDAIHEYFGGKQPPAVVKVKVGTFTKADATQAH